MKALFVVETGFLGTHVGVRRVILHYLRLLEQRGHVVEFAALRDDKLTLLNVTRDPNGTPAALAWDSRMPRQRDYGSIVVTNPWLAAAPGMPELRGCLGIVYDLVPNLIAAGCLAFEHSAAVYRFAHEHDVGYRYLLRNAKRIICISESTRADFLEFYGALPTRAEIVARTPFQVTEYSITEEPGNRVLLVNVLDPRKNLTRIAEVLLAAHAHAPIGVDIVGGQRASRRLAADFFYRLSTAGVDFEWHRNAPDALLQQLYQRSAVLLFPSLYEGCGLPVLEAQQAGLPVITSTVSSLPELAQNSSLCFAVDDVAGMASAVSDLVHGRRDILRGAALHTALEQSLARQPDMLRLLAV